MELFEEDEDEEAENVELDDEYKVLRLLEMGKDAVEDPRVDAVII